jgi:GT2 family glycosyltransferase
VVIVNYRGAQDTLTCLQSLRSLDWPAGQLEIIVVDNASGDGSAEKIRAAEPDITVVASQRNTGFAGGCNLGVEHATGEFIALINNDARPDAAWIAEAVREMGRDSSVAAVASRVLDWEGKSVDFVGGHVTLAGHGYKLEHGEPDAPKYHEKRDVLFFTGSAAVLRADVFRAVGGFDEQYFMFFEDVDLGWRLNLLGYRVRYVPDSLVYHRHHAAISSFAPYRERYLLERNALLTIFKNFSDDILARVLAPVLLLAVHRGVQMGGADPTLLDLQRTPTGDDEPTVAVDKATLTTVYAVDYLARNLPALQEQRDLLQSMRRRDDYAIPDLANGLLHSLSPDDRYNRTWNSVVEIFQLDQLPGRARRIVVITEDPITPQMAGPAIRAMNIALQLSAEHDVTLVSMTKCTITHPTIDMQFVPRSDLRKAVADQDIVIFQGFVLHHAQWLANTDKILIVDIYDPIHLEQLEQTKAHDPSESDALIASTTEVLNQQLARGDFFMCASEEQRHFWLGQLAALGRLNPSNYDKDSSLRSLLAVCPFGLPDDPPVRTAKAIRGVTPGIGDNEKVILWGGGVYNWFDPVTLILAVHKLSETHPDVRLFFLGMKHPNPEVPEMQTAWEARALASRLGMTGKFVFFNEGWVSYTDRQNYLLDADIGVSTHYEHVETTFSFRTRILDYLWAGLPIVTTQGDTFSRLVDTEALGAAVPQRDVDALCDALERTLYDEDFREQCRANVARVRAEYTWSRVLDPLTAFCREPRRAPDLEDGHALLTPGRATSSALGEGIFARNLRYAKARMKDGGPRLVLTSGLAKAGRLLRGGFGQGADVPERTPAARRPRGTGYAAPIGIESRRAARSTDSHRPTGKLAGR